MSLFLLFLQVCERRPDLLNIDTNCLLEIEDYISLDLKATHKNLFKILEFIPPTLLVPDKQHLILERLTSWNGFCVKYNLDPIIILIKVPIVLMFEDHVIFEERFDELRDYFAVEKDVSTFITNMPNVLVDFWPSLKAKMDFVIHEMMVSPKTLSRTKVLEYDLNHIKVIFSCQA